MAPPSALRAATSPWLRHREDQDSGRLQRRIVGVAHGPRRIPGLRIVRRPVGAVPDPLDEIGVADERTAESDRIGGAAGQRLVGERDGVVAVEDQRKTEEQTSELQSLMRISYAVLCLK